MDHKCDTRTIIHTPCEQELSFNVDINKSMLEKALKSTRLLYLDGRNSSAACEILQQARLQHPHIISLLDAERDRNDIYFDNLVANATYIVCSDRFLLEYHLTKSGEF